MKPGPQSDAIASRLLASTGGVGGVARASKAALPREPEEASTLQEAEHWLKVYREYLDNLGKLARESGVESELQSWIERSDRRRSYWARARDRLRRALERERSDRVRILRDKERLVAMRYGADNPPRLLDQEDLESQDPADAEHWVLVYREMVDALRTAQMSTSEAPPEDGQPVQGRLQSERAIRLETKMRELHLAFWGDELARLRRQSPPDNLQLGHPATNRV